LNETGIALVAPSLWLKNAAESSSVFKGLRVTHIENPVSANFFSAPSQEVARGRLGIDKGTFVGAVVASQLDNPIKQVKKLAEVFFESTSRLGVASTLLLIGASGQLVENIHPSAKWLGELESEELSQVISAANFLGSASLSESAGMTIREAGAVGVPSIALRNGGSDELVQDGNTGFLVGNMAEFGAKISFLAQNPQHSLSLGQSAKASAINCAHPEVVAQKYLKLYDGLL
jgi:glycosyltransferase involved in cell wall biosynthesis